MKEHLATSAATFFYNTLFITFVSAPDATRRPEAENHGIPSASAPIIFTLRFSETPHLEDETRQAPSCAVSNSLLFSTIAKAAAS
jgi:hypothetical protein